VLSEFTGTAAGKAAVANAEKRLAEMRAQFTVRPSSGLVNRFLAITETTEMPPQLGPEFGLNA
jgi:hypothetical protein